MKKETLHLQGIDFPLLRLHTVIAGCGAAGYLAAVRLFGQGITDIAIVTDDAQGGASRNAGSDKQTYYKLSLQGAQPDSVYKMAQTLFDGGSMHGDLALVEAALSAGCFTHLAQLGVPFPTNAYGEYIGYQTDHDSSRRATSAGPLTSRYMVQCLEAQAKKRNIPLLDGYRIAAVLTSEGRAMGLLAFLKGAEQLPHRGMTIIFAENVILATGGPAALYASSAYPSSQTGCTGAALLAGAEGVNLTEWQYGIASLAPRWNLSGTYQQVLPRYISTDKDGKYPVEFLEPVFQNKKELLAAIFLKGYQWPFDPAKLNGSSLIDLLVYQECSIKGRRVFLDYAQNPSCCGTPLTAEMLEEEPQNYLQRSNALFGTPIERLERMNPAAIAFFQSKGVDLAHDLLEIDVCAQHCNGGLTVNPWYETTLPHLFAIGEAAGVFGVHRPGGCALNSTQVGAMRAAQYIAHCYQDISDRNETFLQSAKVLTASVFKMFDTIAAREYVPAYDSLFLLRQAQARSTAHAAFVRDPATVQADIAACLQDLDKLTHHGCLQNADQLSFAVMCHDTLLTQLALLRSIEAYEQSGGGSRGSYMILDEKGCLPSEKLPSSYRCREEATVLREKLLHIALHAHQGKFTTKAFWVQRKPIPQNDDWFETAWQKFNSGEYLK